jgi:hypothetical protein
MLRIRADHDDLTMPAGRTAGNARPAGGPAALARLQALAGNRAVSRALSGLVLQRCGPGSNCDCPPEERAEKEAALARTVQRDDSGPETVDEVHDAACAKSPGCPDDFCRPFASQEDARNDRTNNLDSAIAGVPNTKAQDYYRRYAMQPGPAGDISGEVGADFQKAETTRVATQQLVDAAQKALKDSPPTFPDGQTVINPGIREVLSEDIIGPIMKNLRFTDYLEVPGLIAGGIDTAQGSCGVGAVPSTQPDERLVDGTFTVSKNDDGSIFVSPVGLRFTVRDTLDFCPGNCGSGLAQGTTVPLSRWEASNISGDLSFTVVFDAPGLVGSPD